MSYDKREFLDTVTQRAQDRNSNLMPILRAAQAVAPVMEKLMTGTDWDKYLQHLQAKVEQAQSAKLNATRKISSPEAADPIVLAKLRVDIISADAMIEAWILAMELPKILVAGGEIALQTIARFEEKDEAA